MLGLTKEKTGFRAKDAYRDTPVSGIRAVDLLGVARLTLLVDFPFFGKIANGMAFVETEEVSTTAVDARGTFYYNPLWVNSFTKEDAVFEVGHEVMHLVQRLWARAPLMVHHGIWNRAADYLADTTLIKAKLPQSKVSLIMVPPEIVALVEKYPTMPAMYKYLLKEAEDNTDCPACQKAIKDLANMQEKMKEKQHADNKKMKEGNVPGEEGSEPGDEPGESDAPGHDHGAGEGKCGGKDDPEHTCGNVRECCAGTSADASKMDPLDEQKWLEKVISAKMHAMAQGGMPAGLGEYIDELTKSKVRWQDHVKTTAARLFGRGRYTYNKLSRRGPAMGIRLPGRQPDGRTAVLAFDTSCSMSTEEVRQCFSEGVAISKLCGCEKIWIILADTRVTFSGWVSETDFTKLKMARGGTDHIDVFKCLDRTHPKEEFNIPTSEKVALVVAFTDLGTTFPKNIPKYEVIWGVPSDGSPGMSAKVPFGTKVEVDMT